MTLDINIKRIEQFINWHLASTGIKTDELPPFSSLEFNINGFCNRTCFFCPRSYPSVFKSENRHLDLELFKKTVNDLAKKKFYGRISFSGFSEPLLTKSIEEYILYAKKLLPEMVVEIVTNGDYLTEEKMLSLFKSGIDNLRISLYDGPEQLTKFNTMARNLGLTDKKVICRARYLSAKENYGLTISNRGGALTLKDGPLHVRPLAEPLKQPCYYPFYKMMIDCNGDVLVCSNDWQKKKVVGNIGIDNIFDVWEGSLFHELRMKLIKSDRDMDPCKMCDVNGLYNGEFHFKAWKSYYEKRH